MPFWSLLRSPSVHIPALVLLLVGLAFGTLMTFLPLYLKQAQVPLQAGIFFSAAAMTSFCVRLGAGAVVRRWGRGLLMSAGLISYALALALLFLAQTPTAFLIGALLEGAGFGVLLPMMSAMMAERALPQERGRVFGICLLGLDLGGAIAAPLFGAVAEQFGYRPLFAIASGCTLLALALFLTRSSKDLGHSLRFALGQGHDGYALMD
jgi:MFS family permease